MAGSEVGGRASLYLCMELGVSLGKQQKFYQFRVKEKAINKLSIVF